MASVHGTDLSGGRSMAWLSRQGKAWLSGQGKAWLSGQGVEHIGIRRYADCLPLLPVRAQRRIPAGAQSVILCLFPYHIGPAGEDAGRNLARYAVLPDYHRVAGRILEGFCGVLQAQHPGEAFAAFVDGSPLREVDAACRAGLGVVGRHGLLIHPVYGAHVFIGEVITTLALAPTDAPGASCPDCGRCIAACPTGALAPDRPLDRSRCRSHITQKKGPLSPWEREQVRRGGLAWGCDLCVDACPLRTDALTPIAAFYHRPQPVLGPPPLPADAALADRAYAYRGRAVLERNLRILAGDEDQ